MHAKKGRKKENAPASDALRKICSAVKKAALFEQLITGSLFNHHTIMNTTKATPDHHKCEFAAFRLSKFFFPSATGVWGHCAPKGFARPTLFWSGVLPSKSRSPQGETLHPLACWRKHQLVC